MEQLQQQLNKKQSELIAFEDVVKQEIDLEQSQEMSIDNFRKTHTTENKAQKKVIQQKPQKVEFKVEKKQFMKSLFKNLGKNNKPGITIGRAQRQLKKQMYEIGPFSYEAKKLENRQGVKFPQASLPTNLIDKNLPGPGSYHKKTEAQQKKQAQYTIGWKYDSIFDIKNNIPGPGYYQNTTQQLLKSKSKAAAINKGFGTSNRFSNGEKSPGPGDYQTFLKSHTSINKKRTISNVGRQSLNKLQPLPGPGLYESVSYFQDSLKKNRGMSIGLSNNRSSVPDLTSESYNKYVIAREFDNQQTGIGFSIGQQKRKFIQVSITPSPQDYSATLAYPHSPSARMNKAEARQNEKKNIPGPGTYEKSLNESSIRYSFTKSKSISQIKPKSQLPGIGRYDINTKMVPKGSSFSKQKKFKAEQKYSVGVGDYNINNQPLVKKGYTIPKAPIHH